jgi:hypothetical protein
MQTTFLWLKSNTFGLYFNFLDYAELIIFVVIILTTIIVCMFLLLANEVKSAIKVFLIGALSIILPVSLLYDARYILLTHPMRDIAWYLATNGAAIAVTLCFIPMFIFVPYTVYMTIVALKKIIKNRRHNKN